METGVHRSDYFKETTTRDEKCKTCELDHRREQQICGKKGRGGRYSKLCVMHCIRPVMHGKKPFPLDEVFASLCDCFGSVT
jgi:hypothetical protein